MGNLAVDPHSQDSAEHLPYPNKEHLRDCLEIIRGEYEKHMKTVHRIFSDELLYRTIETGFYVGANDEIIYYYFPRDGRIEER